MVMTTEHVLADMIVENTGIALCDSGGAYGRNWERNQGLTVGDLCDRPDAEIVGWKAKDGTEEFGWVNVDVFHYLASRLEYHDDVNSMFMEYAEQEENKDVPWLVLMEEFAAAETWGENIVFNSYNSETLLSQTIQGVLFEYADQPYVLLQIHGGCDVRGGYTAPKAFRLCEGDIYSIFYGWNSFFLNIGSEGFYFRDGECINMKDWEPCEEPDTSNIVKKDGEWIWKPTGESVEVHADNDI